MRKTVATLSFAFALALMASSAAYAADPIKIGVVLPLTGTEANFGEIEKLSFEMALEEINAKGGVKGSPINVIFEDDSSKPDVGRSAIEKLIRQDGVALVGGGYSSSVTAAMAGVAVNNAFPLVINTGSADNITEPWTYTVSGQMAAKKKKGMSEETDAAKKEALKKEADELAAKAEQEATTIMPRYAIFRINPPASEYASGIESLLTDVIKPKTAALLHENSAFGTSSAADVEKRLTKLGVKILIKESYDKASIDFKPVLSKVKEANPDIVYMVSYVNDAALLMNQSMELRLNPKMFIGGGAGFTMPEFQKNAGKASEKVVSATLWHQTLKYPGAKEYYDKFLKKYNRDTEYHGAEAYAAMYVIADALKRAKSLSKEDITKALAETDMMTVFGPVKFATYGKKANQNKGEAYVVQWIKGEQEIVWPKKYATTDVVFPVDWIKERQ